MSLAVAIVVLVLCILLSVLVLFAAMPLRLELEVHKSEAWCFRAGVRPFGRYGPRIPLSGRKPKPDRPEEKPLDARPKPKKRKLRTKGLASAVIRLIGDILQRICIDTARLQMRFGLGDPAETGQVFGYLSPLIYGTAPGQAICLEVEPVFDRAVLQGEAELDLSVVPATLLGPLFRFAWSAFGPVR
ncbi:DUF2953 domain-containing protein [Boseongicola aestuarii]|uniref:DUF2953 domain-containing protein n=1 Tax=Boseongicola aestuarii TaxID=1470561 RepID=A0A238IUJ8_9RHOB|nr:DUF2953 domain-containing protein [Boseongicola aestuarii]SMX21977.1 hypothetical protein BOA8489_00064 [Boseongicola aestuarii]